LVWWHAIAVTLPQGDAIFALPNAIYPMLTLHFQQGTLAEGESSIQLTSLHQLV